MCEDTWDEEDMLEDWLAGEEGKQKMEHLFWWSSADRTDTHDRGSAVG